MYLNKGLQITGNKINFVEKTELLSG